MFIGEALCLFALGISRYRESRRPKQYDYRDPLLSPTSSSLEPKERRPPVCSPIFILPTICDLTATTFGGIGLLYTTASVWRMFRGSIILFSGILSMIFLKRKMFAHNWIGMLTIITGLGIVGTAGFLASGATADSTYIIGALFILGGQLLGAVQMVVEEVFLRERYANHSCIDCSHGQQVRAS